MVEKIRNPFTDLGDNAPSATLESETLYTATWDTGDVIYDFIIEEDSQEPSNAIEGAGDNEKSEEIEKGETIEIDRREFNKLAALATAVAALTAAGGMLVPTEALAGDKNIGKEAKRGIIAFFAQKGEQIFETAGMLQKDLDNGGNKTSKTLNFKIDNKYFTKIRLVISHISGRHYKASVRFTGKNGKQYPASKNLTLRPEH